jgi:hypothetical protein
VGEQNRRNRLVELNFTTSSTTPPGTYEISYEIYTGGFGCAPFFGCVDNPIKIVKRHRFRVKVTAGQQQASATANAVYPVTGMPRLVASPDLNDDGISDIVIMSYDENASSSRSIFSIFLARLDRSFEPEVIAASVNFSAGGFVVKDIDHDNVKDLVAIRGNEPAGAIEDTHDPSGEVVLAGRDSKIFPTAQRSYYRDDDGTGTYKSIHEFEVGDLNNDLLDDRVLTDGEYIEIFLGRGSRLFDLSNKLSIGYEIGITQKVDFNNDGSQDLIVVQKSTSSPDESQVSAISVLLGDGVGGFHEASTLNVQGRVLDVTVADFDGNGLADFVVIGPDNNEWRLYLQ